MENRNEQHDNLEENMNEQQDDLDTHVVPFVSFSLCGLY